MALLVIITICQLIIALIHIYESTKRFKIDSRRAHVSYGYRNRRVNRPQNNNNHREAVHPRVYEE